MTVKHLMMKLEAMEPDMKVYFAHPSHNFWGHELSSPVMEVTEDLLHFSTYHQQLVPYKQPTDHTEDQEADEEEVSRTTAVVLLR